MNKKLCFVTNSTDFSLLETTNVEIFSFDYESHKNLQKLDIKHSIAEEFLDDNERFELFFGLFFGAIILIFVPGVNFPCLIFVVSVIKSNILLSI